MTLRLPHLLGCIPATLLLCASFVSAAGIESDPNKTYALTKKCGPWMIKVATLHTTGTDGNTAVGKSPEQAAQELVLELRKLGMPAYVYVYDPKQERVVTVDRANREQGRKNLRRVKETCVLAGNYPDLNDKTAQASLAWIKKLNPKCLQEGVTYQATKVHPYPLSAAFLAPNPLLTEEELQQFKQDQHDPLLVKLNSGELHSLYENRGAYTLVVARFYGKKKIASGRDNSPLDMFLSDNDLDEAALSARELVSVLRGNYDRETNFNNLDAYVWHDQHESIVTVGSFAGPDDPAYVRVRQAFAPKMKNINGNVMLQPEHLGISGFGPKANESRMWLFEPDPQLMRVPRIR
ncbi:hypothetical protein [Planctomicrobium sp. SH664]|uniref:hypothetical protein n=1 Tax=Planctomicrobium sp. SH664 TaxID=3448125 RepID=UPI003F5B38CD